MDNLNPIKKPALISLRRYFLAGLAVLSPILITVFLVSFLLDFTENIAGKHFNSFIRELYGFVIPGLGLFFTIVIILFIGMVSVHLLGKRFFPFLERLVLRIPIIGNIYPPARRLSLFLFDDETKRRFGKVVMIEYPYPGAYCLGFITNEELTVFNKKVGQELVSVLISLPPSPITGILMMVPKDKIKLLDISMEDAITFVVSAAVVAPKE